MRGMMKRKAQTATEYLIILAVVIIIALIVVGVLGGIPGIGTGSSRAATASFWSTADVGVDGVKVAGQDVTVNFKNNNADTIKITAVQVNETVSYRDGTGDTLPSGVITLAPGQTTLVTLASVIPGAGCTSGDPVNLFFAINYTNQATGGSFTYKGQDSKYETVCSS